MDDAHYAGDISVGELRDTLHERLKFAKLRKASLWQMGEPRPGDQAAVLGAGDVQMLQQ